MGGTDGASSVGHAAHEDYDSIHGHSDVGVEPGVDVLEDSDDGLPEIKGEEGIPPGGAPGGGEGDAGGDGGDGPPPAAPPPPPPPGPPPGPPPAAHHPVPAEISVTIDGVGRLVWYRKSDDFYAYCHYE
eukprot:886389-Pyramimonas_sp.AAC.1